MNASIRGGEEERLKLWEKIHTKDRNLHFSAK